MSVPRPDITDQNRPYWDSLAQGVLLFQRCRGCKFAWLPPRSHCPNCLSASVEWEPSAGIGRVVSWVVYHHAYADHLKGRLPYDVTIVELDEGPRLLTNVVNSEKGLRLAVDAPVGLNIEFEDDFPLARFRLLA